MLPVLLGVAAGVGVLLYVSNRQDARVSYGEQLDLFIERVARYMSTGEGIPPVTAELENHIKRARELGRTKDAEGLEAVLNLLRQQGK